MKRLSRTLKVIFLCSLTGLTAISSSAIASNTTPVKQESAKTTININKNVLQVSGHVGIGYLSGKTTETVYIPELNHRLSKLEWDLRDVVMANFGGSVTFNEWLTFNGNFSTALNEGNGSMDDYDWFITNYEWTHWSHHSDTDLTKGYMLDLNAEFTFYKHYETNFNALVGYKRDYWKWEARGGSYVYSSYNLHDTKGNFQDGELGITYSQWYDVPYVGLGFDSRVSDFEFLAKFIYSPIVFAGDEDIHHMRDLKFEEDFDPTTMWAIDIGGSYFITDNFSAQFTYHYQKYNEAKGTTTITDLKTGAKTFYDGDVAGTSHDSSLFNLSLVYDF